MHAGVREAVVILCLAAVAAAQGAGPVPLDGEGLVSGRNVLLSVSADTIGVGASGDSPSGRLVRTRSVPFDRRAPDRDYSELRPRLQYALAGAGLGLLLGTGLGLQATQSKDASFDTAFRKTTLYGGLGALLGLVLVVHLTDF